MRQPHLREKDWITKAGLRAVVVVCYHEGEGHTARSHRCGYVGIPPSHPLYDVPYNVPHDSLPNGATPECHFRVHGGITYSTGDKGINIPPHLRWRSTA